MTILGSIALAVLVSALVSGVVIEDRICSKLRARHPDLWRELGSPERFFDDGGLMRHYALAKLFRSPDLLGRCQDLGSELRFARTFGRISFAFAWIAGAICLACILKR